MKKIMILMTGGTIASVSTKQGLVPDNEGTLLRYDYMREKEMQYSGDKSAPQQVLLEWKEVFNLDSSNVAPKEWKLLAEEIESLFQSKKYDGIVVTHGTDTMAYTMAGISFLLKEVPIPVVFTGSQLPFEAEDTDAIRNLTDAITTAVDGVPGIVLVFAGRIIDALYVKKVYSRQKQAFESVHMPEAGCIDAQGRIIWNHTPVGVPDMAFLRDEIDRNEPDCNLHMRPYVNSQVNPQESVLSDEQNLEKDEILSGMTFSETATFREPVSIRLLPGMNGALIDTLVQAGYRAIILEVFGCGGIPENLLPTIRRAKEKHTAVFAVSQCLHDGTDLSVYEVGSKAMEAGVISAHDLTVEALSAWMICESLKL